MTKLPDGQSVCELCREIVPTETLKEYVRSITWDSFSGTNIYGKCCRYCHTTRVNKDGYLIGVPYA